MMNIWQLRDITNKNLELYRQKSSPTAVCMCRSAVLMCGTLWAHHGPNLLWGKLSGRSWSTELERPRQWSNSFKRLQKCFCSSSRDEEPLPPPDTCYSFPCLLVQAYSIVVQETTGLNWFSMENGMSLSTYSFCSSWHWSDSWAAASNVDST